MNPADRSSTDTAERDGTAQIAYVVLAHSDPQLFGRLMRRLDDPRAIAVVHVDAKAPIEPFRRAVAGLHNVRFVEPRVRVMWAGFSVVEATMAALRAAVEQTTEECSHIILISGSDYPLTSNNEIVTFFQKHLSAFEAAA